MRQPRLGLAAALLVSFLVSMPRLSRGGCSKSAYLFLNAHGLRTALLDPTTLTNYSVSFFSETWLVDPAPVVANRDFFGVPAKKPHGRGRPSGGLHLYCNPLLGATLLSSSSCHIAVSTPLLTCIGVYFEPESDLDDIILCLANVLNNAPSALPVLIGGDFNLHPDSAEFREVSDFLRHYDVLLISDPSVPTFFHARGSSCIDYVFGSSSLKVSECSCPPFQASDHAPLKVVLKLPRRNHSAGMKNSCNSRLDVQRCVDFLEDQSLLELPLPELVDSIDEFFGSSNASVPIKPKTSKPWFSSYAYELRRKCLRLLQCCASDPSFSSELAVAKTAYHRHLRWAKKAYDQQQCDNLIEAARRDGIRVLYRRAKTKSSGSSIPLHSLYTYSKELFSVDDPSLNTFQLIPSCEQNDHSLLIPFTMSEILNCVSSLRSKAKSNYRALSPIGLRLLSPSILPVLQRVFNLCLSSSSFPSSWLESTMFFLYKKGDRSLPSNYRTIAIENPFLKVFMLLLTHRMSHFAEQESLLPDMQFGFRKSRSCLSAASILYHVASSRLSRRQRTHCVFIDFSKAFDSVCRTTLFTKLQLMGFPLRLCLLLFHILSRLEIRIKKDEYVSPGFHAQKGTPQGDPLSPLLFSLFLADLPQVLSSAGIELSASLVISFLQYADDLVLFADSPASLQSNLDALAIFCRINHLAINVSKSKYMVFFRGRLPAGCSVSINGHLLERVSRFSYLGFLFSTQLSFSHHVSECISKANARIAWLFHSLPLKHLPLATVLRLFDCFIWPIFTYGIHLWLTRVSQSTITSLNSLFTKFLKRYLCLPFFTLNSITHFLTITRPLFDSLLSFAHSHPLAAGFPRSMSGLLLIPPSAIPQPPPEFSPIPLIPSAFWVSRVIHHLPLSPERRRSLLYPIVSTFFPPFARSDVGA